jgi:hypothetical protein
MIVAMHGKVFEALNVGNTEVGSLSKSDRE